MDAVGKLETVLKEIFAGSFEDEVRALTENEKWYRATLGVDELFRLWVRSRILEGEEPGWVFRGLRMADRRRLFHLVGLDPNTIAGATPAEHAEFVLDAVGLPVKRTRGHRALVADWRELDELIAAGEDERAAVLGRQRAERFLRKLLYFFCATGHAGVFAEMIKDPGSLRVPKAFQSAGEAELAALFLNDDVADLGFLALALRKFAKRLEEASVLGLSGAPLVLFTQKDYDAFSTLGTALQPYTHDKPSRHGVRREHFLTATRAVSSVISTMAGRNVVPDDVFVLETCSSLVGRVFRGVTDEGVHVHFMSPSEPPLGERLLFLASAGCRYATCVWAVNPWRS